MAVEVEDNDSDKQKLFDKVKYKVTGKVDEEVEHILQNNGAQGFSYFSDYVTHCIVGSDPVDTDISDANDLYEVPAVTQDWVTYSLKCNKLLPTSAFKGGEKLLLTGVVASFSKLSQDDSKKLWAMLKYYGGTYSSTFTKSTTHLIVSKPEGQKYEQALKCSDIIHVVTPDWLIDSVRTNSLCAEILYHPRLLIIEKPQPKSDYQSTAHITGFADDVIPDESPNGVIPSSEILQQLKLRMPWNQPNQSVSSASSTQGPLSSATSTIQKQVFSGSQMGMPHPRPVSSILQQSRPPSLQTPQQQLLQQRALQQQQQQRLLHQPGVQQWRPQNQLQQQQQLGQKPGLQLAVLQQQLHQQQPIQQQGVHQQSIQQPIQQPQHLQQHLALTQQKSLLQQQSNQQHFIVHENQQQNGPSQQPQQPQQQQQQQSLVPQMVQHQVVQQQQQQQQQQSFVTLSNSNQINWNQQQQQHHQQQQFQLRHQQLQQLQQQQQQQQPQLSSQQQTQIQQRQITWTQQTQQQGPPRQLIHMDAATHAQLQQMDPQQRAMFLHNLQKQRQIALQRQMQQQQQQQQRQVVQQQQQTVGGSAGGSTVVVSGGLRQQSVAVIRGHIPSGLNPQQQLQWLQQQRHQQQIVIQQNTQLRQQVLVQQQQQQPDRQMSSQQLITNNTSAVMSQPQQPVLQTPSWAQQQSENSLQGQAGPQQQQQQMAQLRQQQLQLHRFQQLQQKQQVSTGAVRLTHPSTPQPMLYNNQMAPQSSVSGSQSSLSHQPLNEPTDSVASSSDLFSVSSSVEGSAAGQLRLMTAQHHAQQLQPPPPSSAPTPSPGISTTMRGNVQTNRVGVTLKTDCGREVTPPSVLGPASKPPYTQTAARVAAVLAKSAAATQPPQHHQRTQFFGHNPNLKLPIDMFLLGCIFLIVEYDRTGDNISEWTRCITEYGGEVESSYTLRVTHIICQTQKHPLVQQGIRDAKRCVTAEWLSDVCLKQQVLPPWLALHFPTPYSEEKPCRNLITSYSGFEGEERSKVKKMIEATGAKLTSYFSCHNNILVCRRPDGDKYKRAREWGKSVVNVQWLNEILFGHYSCLQQPDSHKYQQYNLGNPFRIDYILVPHLMAAWKAPINVTQDSYERLKTNPPSTTRRKRPRVSYPNQYMENNENENKNCMMEGIEIINSNPPPPEKRPVILFSGSYGESQKEEAKRVLMLGGSLAHTANEATHLVVNGGVTIKLYCCVTTCKYIVTSQWLADSFARSHFIDENSYMYSNPELEKQYNFRLSHTILMPNRRNLFKNKKFFLTPGVVPGRNAMKEMIEYAGGSVDRQRRSLKFMQDQEPFSYFVIAVPKDYHLVADVLRSSIGVYSTEFVMTCLLRQSVEHEATTMVIKRNVNKQGR